MSTAAVTKSGKQKKPDAVKAEAWPASYTSGIKQRKSYTKRAALKIGEKVPNTPENYVPWSETDAENLKSFVAFAGIDEKQLLGYAVAGYNAAQRQAAAFGERKILSMVEQVLKQNPRLSREKAEKKVRALLSES